jgi:hypothetical protein
MIKKKDINSLHLLGVFQNFSTKDFMEGSFILDFPTNFYYINQTIFILFFVAHHKS